MNFRIPLLCATGFVAVVFNMLLTDAAMSQERSKAPYSSALVKKFLASEMGQEAIEDILIPVLKKKTTPQACKGSIDSFLAFDASMRASMAAQREASQSREEALNNARRAGLPPAVLASIAKTNEMAAQQSVANAQRTQESFDNYMSYIDTSCKGVK